MHQAGPGAIRSAGACRSVAPGWERRRRWHGSKLAAGWASPSAVTTRPPHPIFAEPSPHPFTPHPSDQHAALLCPLAHLHFCEAGVPAARCMGWKATSTHNFWPGSRDQAQMQGPGALASGRGCGPHLPATTRCGAPPETRQTHLFNLSAHSAAINSAPLLLPLATVTIVMGMGRTDRASGF